VEFTAYEGEMMREGALTSLLYMTHVAVLGLRLTQIDVTNF